MDVAAWLRGLGLGQYEQAFRENDIDAEVLVDLTAEDLIGLGVTFDRPPPQAARRHRCPARRLGAGDHPPTTAPLPSPGQPCHSPRPSGGRSP